MSAGGTVQQIGNAYEWQHTSGLGIQITVTASPRDGRTRLRLRQLVGLASSTKEGLGYGLLPAMLVGLLGGVGGKALVGGSVAVSALAAFVAFMIAWAIATPVIAHLDRNWRAKKLRQLDALADDLGNVLATSTPVSAEPSSTPDSARLGERVPEAGVLDVRLLDDEVPEASGESSVRRVRE